MRSAHQKHSYLRLLPRAFLPMLAIGLLLGVGGMLWHINTQMRTQQIVEASEGARIFAQSVSQFRNYYSSEVVPRAKKAGVVITHNYTEIEGALPLPAAFTLDFGAFLARESDGFKLTVFSQYPFPMRAGRVLDDFQKAALTAIEANPDQPFVRVEQHGDKRVLRYAVGDLMRPECVACHNTYPQSPKTDWQVGDLRGVFEITRPIDTSAAELWSGMRGVIFGSMGMIVALLVTVWAAMHGLRKAGLETRTAYEQLRQAQDDLRQRIFALDQHAIVSVADPAGNIIEANERFTEISGYTLDEVLGKNHRILNSKRHPPEFFKDLWRTISAGRVWSGEVCNRRKDGTLYWVAATIVPFLGAAGRPERYISIRTDISARKAWEAETLRAKDDAEAANRAKSDFLANMSHEIRTPMNGVIGMTGLALDTDNDRERREYLHIVKASAESLLGILNDILDFSKIEANKLTLEKVAFDLPRTLLETLRALSAKAHDKGLEVVCDIAPDVPTTVAGDPTRLRQVWVNLIGNAIKFTSRGEILVNLSVEARHDSQVTLICSVKDTGIGIPADKLEHVFEAFSQADTSTTREHGGTGLGLSIASRLVQLMHGQMSVVSEPGQGTTFQFTVVLEARENPIPSVPDLDLLQGKQVLLTDDHAVNRAVLSRQLAKWGVVVTATESGREALQRLAGGELTPDVAILDQHMPGMDGITLTEILKGNPRWAHLPVLILSSGMAKGQADRARALGVKALLTKPVFPQDLGVALLRAMDLGKDTAAASAPAQAEGRAEDAPLRFKVLLVEDNLVNQKLAQMLLVKQGCTVDVAENGEKALAMLTANGPEQRHHYDVIFMDMQMPVMGGLEATRRIREQEAEWGWAPARIVAMTANAMQGDREACLAAGMDDYLSKPIKPSELASKLPAAKGEHSL